MARLRVLSGRHAGVFLDWHSHPLMVGASEELDVYIGDWNMQPLELRQQPDGPPQARWRASPDAPSVTGERADGDHRVCDLAPWVPVRFGAVILCIGPEDEPWPDDAELLERCFAPAPGALAAADGSSERRQLPVGKRIMTGALAFSAIVAMSSSIPQRMPPTDGAMPEQRVPTPADEQAVASDLPVPSDPVARLRALPGASLLGDLDLVLQNETILVIGVLPSRLAVDRVNELLDAAPADLRLRRRFAAVPDILDRLHQALGRTGVRVQHAEGRRFRVSGRVADPGPLRAAVANVAADLAAFGTQIDTDLQPLNDSVAPMSSLLIDSRGTSILRTRDGVRHIVTSTVPDEREFSPSTTAMAPDARAGAPSTPSETTVQELSHDTR